MHCQAIQSNLANLDRIKQISIDSVRDRPDGARGHDTGERARAWVTEPA
jgi:hypothetical protein